MHISLSGSVGSEIAPPHLSTWPLQPEAEHFARAQFHGLDLEGVAATSGLERLPKVICTIHMCARDETRRVWELFKDVHHLQQGLHLYNRAPWARVNGTAAALGWVDYAGGVARAAGLRLARTQGSWRLIRFMSNSGDVALDSYSFS